MNTLTCDVCGDTINKRHEFGGNISAFSMPDTCDWCWDYLDGEGNAELKEFEEKQAAARDKVKQAIITKAKDRKNVR